MQVNKQTNALNTQGKLRATGPGKIFTVKQIVSRGHQSTLFTKNGLQTLQCWYKYPAVISGFIIFYNMVYDNIKCTSIAVYAQ